MTGHEDALIHVVAADAKELQRVLLALSRSGVQRFTTMLKLQTFKPPTPLSGARDGRQEPSQSLARDMRPRSGRIR